ncbi:MAG TPA: DUF3168 domain-containing protein [Allosphingosinicella sp.]|nr:DUF3168 domain-containing protein [Allosphingosinicella sp.]
MNAGEKIQSAAVAALRTISGLGVYDGKPVQAAHPYAVVEAGPETDWSHKSGSGRELRIAVTLYDKGERPQRLHALLSEVETVMGSLPDAVEGWQLVTLQLVRCMSSRDGQGRWIGSADYRARMLATG